MARIFWDTNLFIYLFEDHPVLFQSVRQLRKRMLARADQLFTSSLTIGEVLAKPAALNQTEVVEQYWEFFNRPTITILAFDAKAARAFAEIRRDKTLRSPDAIQLACAASARIDMFVTNDRRLAGKVVPGVPFISGLDHALL